MRRLGRILLLALAGLVLAPAVRAGEAGPEDLKQLYEKKISHEFVQYGGWITDYDEARARARKEGKVLFVYFSRSYAP